MEKTLYLEELQLSSGRVLSRYHLHYWINAPYQEGQQVILFSHALTGDARVDRWWEKIAGEQGVFAQSNYHLICINHLGSCYGSTGPLSVDEETGKPYYNTFPSLSIKDLALAQYAALQTLGYPRLDLLIGASLGGQVGLELALKLGVDLKAMVLVACNAAHSAWGIAFNESQRQAIALDPSWSLNQPQAGSAGLGIARSVALLSYRSYAAYEQRQGRRRTDDGKFKAATYQQYQAAKIQERFNAFSYWCLSRAMDSHAIAEDEADRRLKLGLLKQACLVVGQKSDWLFPFEEQEYLAEHIPKAKLCELRSPDGHDGFLIE